MCPASPYRLGTYIGAWHLNKYKISSVVAVKTAWGGTCRIVKIPEREEVKPCPFVFIPPLCIRVCVSHHPVASSYQGGGRHHGAPLQDADLWRPAAWLRREEEHVHSASTANWKRQGRCLKLWNAQIHVFGKKKQTASSEGLRRDKRLSI